MDGYILTEARYRDADMKRGQYKWRILEMDGAESERGGDVCCASQSSARMTDVFVCIFSQACTWLVRVVSAWEYQSL